MPPLDGSSVVGVLGAGAMGSGIAQVAATRGHQVVLVDEHAGALERAAKSLAKSLGREVEKGRMSADDATAITARIQPVRLEGSSAMDVFAECGIVIEAIVERLDAKRDAFARLEGSVRAECVLATNTSSLSVSSIASACASTSTTSCPCIAATCAMPLPMAPAPSTPIRAVASSVAIG